jgi:hypothetical protein
MVIKSRALPGGVLSLRARLYLAEYCHCEPGFAWWCIVIASQALPGGVLSLRARLCLAWQSKMKDYFK